LTAAFSTPQGNLSALTASVVASQGAYKNGTFMTGSFLENHDQPRFQSLTQDQSLVKNAMTWPFMHDGIPILYYGQEQGYAGGGDPANREALWLSAYATEKPLVSHVKSLNAARKAAITTNNKFLTTPMKFLPQSSSSVIAITKPPLLTLLSNGGNSSSPSWTAPDALFKNNEGLVDILTCNTMSATAKGGLSVNGNQGMPQVIMPASALSKTGSLCASVATGDGKASASGALGSGVSWAVVVGAAAAFGLAGLFV
jgi:alpha-amylase